MTTAWALSAVPVPSGSPGAGGTPVVASWPLWPIVTVLLIASAVVTLVLLRRWLAAGTQKARVRR